MKKSEFIKRLQAIEGDPEVVVKGHDHSYDRAEIGQDLAMKESGELIEWDLQSPGNFSVIVIQ